MRRWGKGRKKGKRGRRGRKRKGGGEGVEGRRTEGGRRRGRGSWWCMSRWIG